MLIGITGYSGVGKTTVLDHFRMKGYTVLSPDIFATMIAKNHGITSRDDIVKSLFVNRKKFYFDNLNEILDEYVEKNKDKNVVIEWMLLPWLNCWSKCDIRIMLTIDNATRINKVLSRDGKSSDSIRIIDECASDCYKGLTDYVELENNYSSSRADGIVEIVTKMLEQEKV